MRLAENESQQVGMKFTEAQVELYQEKSDVGFENPGNETQISQAQYEFASRIIPMRSL